jgi:anaerobic C4-dicarboxylate transporter
LRNNDGLLAGGTTDLPAGVTNITLDMLATTRAGKFEFGHSFTLNLNFNVETLTGSNQF